MCEVPDNTRTTGSNGSGNQWRFYDLTVGGQWGSTAQAWGERHPGPGVVGHNCIGILHSAYLNAEHCIKASEFSISKMEKQDLSE